MFYGIVLKKNKDLNVKKVGMKELIEIALAVERSGYNIFNDLAQKYVSNKRLAKIFIQLASEEEGHIKIIEEFEKKYLKEHNFLASLYDNAVVRDYFKDFSYFYIMKDYKKYLKRFKKIHNEIEAVKIAIDLEINSIIFYDKFYKLNYENKEVAKLIEELLHFESNHLEILSQYINKNLSELIKPE